MWAKWMAGQPESKGAAKAPRPMVEIRDLHFYRGTRRVLADINLCFPEDHLIGLIGPNGGGKTTLLKLMVGLLRPTRGSISLAGRPPQYWQQKDNLVGYVPQRSGIPERFPASVFDVVAMGLYRQTRPWRALSREQRFRVQETIDRFGLGSEVSRPIGNLSVGQQQRAFIARALVARPKLLLLDEPVAGVDTAGRQDFYESLLRLKREFRLTIVMVSHEIDQLVTYSDRVACLNQTIHWHDQAQLISEAVLKEVYGCELHAFYAHHGPAAL